MGKILDKHWPFEKKWYKYKNWFFDEDAKKDMEKNEKAMTEIEYNLLTKKDKS